MQHNSLRIGNKKEEKGFQDNISRECLTPSKNRFTAFPKKTVFLWDSNLTHLVRIVTQPLVPPPLHNHYTGVKYCNRQCLYLLAHLMRLTQTVTKPSKSVAWFPPMPTTTTTTTTAMRPIACLESRSSVNRLCLEKEKKLPCLFRSWRPGKISDDNFPNIRKIQV